MDEKKDVVNNLFEAFTQFRKLQWNQSPVPGLRSSEIFVLYTISCLMKNDKEGVKISEISRALDVAAPSVTQVVNHLHNNGFVDRAINEKDRRAVKVILTQKGQKALYKATEAFNKVFTGLVEYLGIEKSNELSELMVKVYVYFEELKDKLTNGGFEL